MMIILFSEIELRGEGKQIPIKKAMIFIVQYFIQNSESQF
jgi:hypothetical protein